MCVLTRISEYAAHAALCEAEVVGHGVVRLATRVLQLAVVAHIRWDVAFEARQVASALGGACVQSLGRIVESLLVGGLHRLGVTEVRHAVRETQVLAYVEVVPIGAAHVA